MPRTISVARTIGIAARVFVLVVIASMSDLRAMTARRI
jgi:hypothetical protein